MDAFEEFENISNSTFEHEIKTDATTYELIFEIIFSILCILGVFINCLIIYTIFRYKKLHQTVANILIANWSIVDIFILITLHSNYRILEILGVEFTHWLYRILYNCEFFFRNAYMSFLFAVTIDWFLASYFSSASQKFRKHYQFTISFIWVFNPMLLFLSLTLSFNFLIFVYMLSYLGFCVLIISLYAFRGVQKCRGKSAAYSSLMLNLVTILLICWLPIWLMPCSDAEAYCWPLLECCYLSTSILTLAVLYRSNRNFQACFQQAIKCSRNRYVDELSEFENFPENVKTESQSVQDNLRQNGNGDN